MTIKPSIKCIETPVRVLTGDHFHCLVSVPYTDTCYELGYSRKLTSQFSLNLGTKAGLCDYTAGDLENRTREDWIVTLSSSLRYSFNEHLGMDVSYSYNRGLNGYYDLPAAQLPDSKRQFVENLVSVGAQWKF